MSSAPTHSKQGPAASVGHGLLGLSALLLACELLLQLLPVSSATHTDYRVSPLILSYPPHFDWVASTGWDLRNVQHNRTNNAGFVGRRDLARKPEGIALIGDSYAEASMLAPSDRPAEQLERALGGVPVYALGMPGSALLDYAERMHWAQRQYGLRRFVLLLEPHDLRQSLCGSGNVHGPCLDRRTLAPRTETRPPPGPVKRLLRHSALARYLSGQLKLDGARLWRQVLRQARAPMESHGRAAPPVAAPSAAPSPTPAALAVTRAFLQRLGGLDLASLVIVLDTDRDALYAGRADDGPDAADLQAFAAALRAIGATVLDARPILASHYRQHRLSFDVGPYDAHLNALGVRLLMEAAGARIAASLGQ